MRAATSTDCAVLGPGMFWLEDGEIVPRSLPAFFSVNQGQSGTWFLPQAGFFR